MQHNEPSLSVNRLQGLYLCGSIRNYGYDIEYIWTLIKALDLSSLSRLKFCDYFRAAFHNQIDDNKGTSDFTVIVWTLSIRQFVVVSNRQSAIHRCDLRLS